MPIARIKFHPNTSYIGMLHYKYYQPTITILKRSDGTLFRAVQETKAFGGSLNWNAAIIY